MNKSRKFAALLFINILLVFFCGIAKAQIEDETNSLYIEHPRIFTIGLVGGANFCQVDGDSYAGYHKIGANFGGIAYARIYKHTALTFELLYNQNGAKSNDIRFSPLDSTTVITSYGINVNYAEIPVMINYFDKRKSHFGMGLTYKRLVSSSEAMTAEPVYSLDFTKYPFKKSGYGLVASAQMHIWKGLFFNIRFQYDLAPIRTLSPPGLARTQKQYNNLWSVRLMYLFI